MDCALPAPLSRWILQARILEWVAVHSLSDFLTDLLVLVFVNISAKPQDKSHDYGHGKFETLATFFGLKHTLLRGSNEENKKE